MSSAVVSTEIGRVAVSPRGAGDWWRTAVIYQVYVRSFSDSNGDGTGDLAGVRSRLSYLRDLGVDALWFSPWYLSPMADGGYDVADYRAIDPIFGNLEEAEGLIAEAAAMGIRTIVDIVPNHISDQHEWFRAALDSSSGSRERERFWFRPGRGPDGSEPPNGWISHFGGPAWTRTTEPEGRPGEWYLHLFAPGQPDLNWDHPEVRLGFEEILRFWFDRDAAGVRIDSAALLVKDPDLPEVGVESPPEVHPFIDRDELHDIYRGWRAVADSYADPRVLIGEIWLDDHERMTRYLRSDELHSAFNFDFLVCPWDSKHLRASIDATIEAHLPVGAPPTWVLSNHDVTRPVTRYGRADTSFSFKAKQFGVPTDIELGTRRARAAALLAMALPGSFYLYQGEELGLPEVETIPLDRIEDPMHFRSGGVDPGRDGCRVPLPWHGSAPPYGFSPKVVETWLPQPADWSRLSVEAQEGDPSSMLSLYRSALSYRRQFLTKVPSTLEWMTSPNEVLAFRRGTVACVTNLSLEPLPLPAHKELLITSAEVVDGNLPPQATAWLRLSDSREAAPGQDDVEIPIDNRTSVQGGRLPDTPDPARRRGTVGPRQQNEEELQ